MRRILLVCMVVVACSQESYSQFGRRFGGRREPIRDFGTFRPSINVSIGYGFPNLDKYLLADFYDYYPGSTSYSGPVVASVDYHFSRRMAIGVMVNYGKVSRPYYNYYTGIHEFDGELTNTAIMLNLTRYIGFSRKVKPYLRTSIGVNIGEADYIATDGSKFADIEEGTTLAYQAGLGVQLLAGKNGGFFIEAGYGKYIVAGGLTLRL